MLKLYIQDRMIDTDDDFSVAFNYQSVETSTPTATKNGFSKSVELSGTETNNDIFGHFWRLDRNLLEGGNMGVEFDPKKRVDFKLVNNGEIIESGYLQLDSITIDGKGNIKYSITLYGGLGDFFYNLMYDENGKERKLDSLDYGFTSTDSSFDEEQMLMFWDAAYIDKSWYRLFHLYDKQKSYYNDLHTNITAAPTYSGKYDDFDNSKVLINYDWLSRWPNSTEFKYLPSLGGTNRPKYGYVIAEASRDLDEWEVGDLRSVYQRPALRMRKLLDAISDPKNNGGYEVIWDDDIRDGAYYNDSWLMFNRLNFDDAESAEVVTLRCDGADFVSDIPNGGGFSVYLNDGVKDTFDLSRYKSPKLELHPILRVKFQYSKTNQIYSRGRSNDYNFWTNVWGGYHLTIDIEAKDKVVETKHYLITTKSLCNATETEWYKTTAPKIICEKLGIDYNNTTILYVDFKATDETYGDSSYPSQFSIWEDYLDINLDLPVSSLVKIKMSMERCETNDGGYSDNYNLFWLQDGLGHIQHYPYEGHMLFANGNDFPDSGYFDGRINPSVQKTRVTKKILFADTQNPYKYLISFTKMLGCRFISDVFEKKIYIKSRKNYYIDEVVDLKDKIDYSQEQKIKPTLTESKWYTMGFESPETYAANLYKKKTGEDYGVEKIDTGYYFNSDIKNLFEDNVYKSALPYKHHSLYFNYVTQSNGWHNYIMPLFLSPTIDITSWNSSDEEVKETIKCYDWPPTLYSVNDETDKLCCFGDDNDNEDDVKDCLVFLGNKFKRLNRKVAVSDNLPIMTTLNENPCYIMGESGVIDRNGTSGTTQYYYDKIPEFSKYIGNDSQYEYSLDFKKPEFTFVKDGKVYNDDITIYNRYWKDWFDDLYDKNSKAVTLYTFLNDLPETAMRKFYWFANSLWILDEITDYDPSVYRPVQCKFIKVKDKNNYLN